MVEERATGGDAETFEAEILRIPGAAVKWYASSLLSLISRVNAMAVKSNGLMGTIEHTYLKYWYGIQQMASTFVVKILYTIFSFLTLKFITSLDHQSLYLQ